MYGWIWRKLPGPTAAKVAQCAGLIIAVIVVLFLVVFPFVSAHLPIDKVTV